MLSQKMSDKRGQLTMAEAGKRKRGRPRKHAPGRRNLTVRVTKSAYQELSKAAGKAGRSVSEEIEFRVHEWTEAQNMRAEAKVQLDANRIQAIRKAGFQIVRDAEKARTISLDSGSYALTGGNVTVNVSPELLLAEAEGILRSGFVAEENIDKSPQEIMIQIQRVVERAVENALTKAGLIGRKGVA
jgi:hypothetical protein